MDARALPGGVEVTFRRAERGGTAQSCGRPLQGPCRLLLCTAIYDEPLVDYAAQAGNRPPDELLKNV